MYGRKNSESHMDLFYSNLSANYEKKMFQSFILYFDNEDFLIMTGKLLRISVSIYVDLMNCGKKLNDKLDRNKLKAHVSRYHSHGKVVLLNHCLS